MTECEANMEGSSMAIPQLTLQKDNYMKKIELIKAERKVAEKLRGYRVEQGLSQNALAEKSGIDRKTVNRIENGHFSPSLSTLFRLCDTLAVKVSEVVK